MDMCLFHENNGNRQLGERKGFGPSQRYKTLSF